MADRNVADKKMTQLAEPEAAIASYLDELLHTATSTALVEESPSRPETKTETRTEVTTETQTRQQPEEKRQVRPGSHRFRGSPQTGDPRKR